MFRTPIAEAVVETQNNARQTHQYIAVDTRNNNNLPTSGPGSGYGLGLIGMAGPLVLIVSAMITKVFLEILNFHYNVQKTSSSVKRLF